MSELDEQKKERQAMIEAKRLRSEDPETGGAAETPRYAESMKPKTFKEKWANYWYHYKALTFGCAFTAVLVVVFVVQVVTATKYDASLSIVCGFPFEALTEEIESNVKEFAEDATGNGQKDVLVSGFTVVSEENSSAVDPQMYAATLQKLAVWPTTNEYYVYLLDDTGYQRMSSMGMDFRDLTSLDNPLIQGDKYYIRDTKLEEKLLAEGNEEELYLCFYNYDAFSERIRNKGEVKAAYEKDWAFFQNLIAFG